VENNTNVIVVYVEDKVLQSPCLQNGLLHVTNVSYSFLREGLNDAPEKSHFTTHLDSQGLQVQPNRVK